MSRRVSLLARVDQIVAKGDWSRERAQQRQAHHVHTRTSDKRGKRLLGTQATIEYYSHQLKKQDKAPKTPQNGAAPPAPTPPARDPPRATAMVMRGPGRRRPARPAPGAPPSRSAPARAPRTGSSARAHDAARQNATSRRNDA